jgi:hypothetical protein
VPLFIKHMKVREDNAASNRSERVGLVSRRAADIIAFWAFVGTVVLLLLVLLWGRNPLTLPTTTTTTTSSSQVINGASAVTRNTKSITKTTSDVLPSVWQSLLGKDQTLFLVIIASLLAAFLIAGTVQRSLLGKYAIGLGPLSVPEITAERVEQGMDSVLSEAPAETEPEAEETIPEPTWARLGDPNLALAGWRIDLEKELRRLAGQLDVSSRARRSPRWIVEELTSRGVIDYRVADGLRDLLTIANEGVHGAAVDPSVIGVLRTEGLRVLQYLRSIAPPAGSPAGNSDE